MCALLGSLKVSILALILCDLTAFTEIKYLDTNNLCDSKQEMLEFFFLLVTYFFVIIIAIHHCCSHFAAVHINFQEKKAIVISSGKKMKYHFNAEPPFKQTKSH